MNTQKTPFIDKFYMFTIAAMPILSRYQIGPLDLDIVLMLVCLFVYAFSSKVISITPVGKPMAFMICYILIVTGANLILGQLFSSRSDIVLRMGRYCIYLFIVFLLGNEHVNYENLMRIYRVIIYIATAYLLLQTVVFYTTGIVLPSKIGGSSGEAKGDIGRLRSFYSEPAALGYNMMPFIACSLFGKNYKKDATKGNEIDALVASVAVVLSTSGQGILCAGLLWGVWLLLRIFKQGLRSKDLLLIVGAVLAILILYASGILEYALGRMESTGEGSAVDARFSGYVALSLLNPLQTIFGTGFGNYVVQNTFDLEVYYQNVNYSSFAEFLFTLGLIGTVIWLFFFLYLYKKGTVCSKMLILALLMLSLLGCPMTALNFPLWLTLICTQLPEGLFKPTMHATT